MKKLIIALVVLTTTLLTSCVNEPPLEPSILDIAYNELQIDAVQNAGPLPSEISGVPIKWSANIPNVLEENTLLPTLTDQEITLTALLEYNQAMRTKVFVVTLKKSEELIDQTLQEALTLLQTELETLLANPLTESMSFPMLTDELTVSYFSDEPYYLSDQGTVTRPSATEGDKSFYLHVTVAMQDTQKTFSIPVTVKALEKTSIYTGIYQGADGLVGDELKAFLHDLIDDHSILSYAELWSALAYTDEDPNNPNNVILIYSLTSIDETMNGGDSDEWNREHVWPTSHGELDGTPAYTDLHHIRPCYVTVNSRRGNLDFDEGGSLVPGTTDAYIDADSFEPPDEVKGDIARMLFYMAVRYEGDVAGELDLEINDFVNNDGPYIGRISVLLLWNEMDPPDTFEQTRNDRIEELQGNRNPFIDYPEFAEYIFSDNQD
jgi:endonuclease I